MRSRGPLRASDRACLPTYDRQHLLAQRAPGVHDRGADVLWAPCHAMSSGGRHHPPIRLVTRRVTRQQQFTCRGGMGYGQELRFKPVQVTKPAAPSEKMACGRMHGLSQAACGHAPRNSPAPPYSSCQTQTLPAPVTPGTTAGQAAQRMRAKRQQPLRRGISCAHRSMRDGSGVPPKARLGVTRALPCPAARGACLPATLRCLRNQSAGMPAPCAPAPRSVAGRSSHPVRTIPAQTLFACLLLHGCR